MKISTKLIPTHILPSQQWILGRNTDSLELQFDVITMYEVSSKHKTIFWSEYAVDPASWYEQGVAWLQVNLE